MENETLESLIKKYKLSEEEHQTIFEELKTKIFSKEISKKNQSIMFVIGQPGCGKTTFIQNTDLTNHIIINSDNFRYLNKYSGEILNK